MIQPGKMMSLLYNTGPRLAAQLSASVISRIDCPDDQPQVFITFDDGPGDGTLLLLDTLDELNMPASFFVTGSHVARHTDVMTRMADRHTVGNHFYEHSDPWTMHPSKIQSSIQRGDAELNEVLGQSPELIRPPFGHVTPGMIRYCRETGKRIVLWDVMPGDFASSDVDGLTQSIDESCHAGSIIVLHDSGYLHARDVLVPLLGRVVEMCRARGTGFGRLGDVLC